MIETTQNDMIALVTGAGGGMGRAISLAFAAEGRSLLLTDFNPAALDETVRAIGDKVPVQALSGDIASPVFPARLAETATAPIATLVHTAGLSPTMADGKRIFDVNFHATQRLVEGLVSHLAPGAALILIASNSGHMVAGPRMDKTVRSILAGKRPLLMRLMLKNPGAAYALSKRAVQLYAQKMAPQLAEKARIVSLSPGLIDTGMGQQERSANAVMDKMIAVTPERRFGRADEIASAVCFLASDAASYINGTDLLVDGGCTAGVQAAGGASKL